MIRSVSVIVGTVIYNRFGVPVYTSDFVGIVTVKEFDNFKTYITNCLKVHGYKGDLTEVTKQIVDPPPPVTHKGQPKPLVPSLPYEKWDAPSLLDDPKAPVDEIIAEIAFDQDENPPLVQGNENSGTTLVDSKVRVFSLNANAKLGHKELYLQAILHWLSMKKEDQAKLMQKMYRIDTVIWLLDSTLQAELKGYLKRLDVIVTNNSGVPILHSYSKDSGFLNLGSVITEMLTYSYTSLEEIIDNANAIVVGALGNEDEEPETQVANAMGLGNDGVISTDTSDADAEPEPITVEDTEEIESEYNWNELYSEDQTEIYDLNDYY